MPVPDAVPGGAHQPRPPGPGPQAAPAQAAEGPLGPGLSLTVVRGALRVAVGAVLRVDQHVDRVSWHAGTVVPGGPGWPGGSLLAGPELAHVVATFNGGFTAAASRGGIRAGGRQLGALRTGAASLVVDGTGRVDVVRWGRDPVASSVLVVRQNLDLLVDRGQPAATVGQDDTAVWGRTLHRRAATWRTAVGVTGSGQLVVVLMARATTRQLARTVVAAGAVRAMELDINPQFSCVLTYTHRGGVTVGHDVLPSQQGSPARYLTSSRRDFFSILTR